MTHRSHKIRRMCALLSVFALALSPLGTAVLAEDLTQDTGMVRVLLTQLKLTDRADVTIAGSYSVDGDSGFTFMRGSQLVFQARGEGILLRYEGMAMALSDTVTLTRHPLSEALTGSENGLRFTDYGALYEGDLTLTNVNGTLRPVLTIQVEDYVKGVVPYEMGDSFPLEALKAQAIAARTYALRQRDATQPYDVEDNTNDQVYRGCTGQSPLSERAATDTYGLVGVYHGQLAECFYTASNGGRTELATDVWSNREGDYGYLEQRRDPFDVENPLSVVRSSSLGKNGAIPPALRALLLERARLSDDQAIDALTALTVEDHDGPEVSITFTVKADSGETESHTVALRYFAELEAMLSLSINSNQNEVIEATEYDDKFVLRARRYGHGVGMSQRGAEWMAKQYAMSHLEILSFYYPGLEWVTRSYSAGTLAPLDDETQGTPAPAASPTPRPTLMPVTLKASEGQYYATVSLSDQGSTLNLRAEPTTASGILYRLFHDQRLLVTEECLDGWVRVKTDVVEGYVMSVYLKIEE